MDQNNRDIISSVTDPILCRILSFLPTKYSVRTSVLSNRWNHLFTLVPVLDFDDSPQEDEEEEHTNTDDEGLDFDDSPQEEEEEEEHTNTDDEGEGNNADSFIRFVNRVLLRYDLPYMHKFNLVCFQECYDDVPSWISAAIARNVCEMFVRVEVRPDENPQYEFIRLPRNLGLSNTLVKLTLDGTFDFNLNDSVTCLPNLKKLHLCGVRIRTGESKQFHSSTFPMLEYLRLEQCFMSGIINISVSSLKRLELNRNETIISFVLNLPALEFLDHISRNMGSFISGNVMESLKEVRIYNNCRHILSTDKTLMLIKMAHNLYLHGSSMDALRGSELPNFQNLTRLKLSSASVSVTGWKLLPDLLERSPNLEFLVLHTESFKDGEGRVDMDHVLPKHECMCLSMHLKELKFERFSGADYEFKLVEYFLNKAKVLKKLTIHTNKPLESRYTICLKLLALSRQSKDCNVFVLNN